MVDWQSESDLESIRNSCDVFISIFNQVKYFCSGAKCIFCQVTIASCDVDVLLPIDHVCTSLTSPPLSSTIPAMPSSQPPHQGRSLPSSEPSTICYEYEKVLWEWLFLPAPKYVIHSVILILWEAIIFLKSFNPRILDVCPKFDLKIGEEAFFNLWSGLPVSA